MPSPWGREAWGSDIRVPGRVGRRLGLPRLKEEGLGLTFLGPGKWRMRAWTPDSWEAGDEGAGV